MYAVNDNHALVDIFIIYILFIRHNAIVRV